MAYYETCFYDGNGKKHLLNKRTHDCDTIQNSRIFDGEMYGVAYTEFEGMTLICASHDKLTVNDLVGRSITVVSHGEEITFTLSEADLVDRGKEDSLRKYIEVRPMSVEGNPIAICAYETTFDENDVAYMVVGVYYLYVENQFYTKVLNYLPEPNETEDMVYDLHPKYLPNRRNYGVFEATFSLYTEEEDGHEVTKYRWNTSMREVDKAYKEGKLIVAKSPDLHPLYCILADPGVVYAFLEIAPIPNIIYMTRQ